MGIPVCRTLILAAAVVAGSALSGCSTTYDSAGNSYLSVWPFIGSRNPDLQLNYPPIDPARLQLSRDPDPFYFMYPQPPVDPRVTSPYSQLPADPTASVAAVGDNGVCAESCDSPIAGVPVRADAGHDRRLASR
jgi:hypothetical protein